MAPQSCGPTLNLNSLSLIILMLSTWFFFPQGGGGDSPLLDLLRFATGKKGELMGCQGNCNAASGEKKEERRGSLCTYICAMDTWLGNHFQFLWDWKVFQMAYIKHNRNILIFKTFWYSKKPRDRPHCSFCGSWLAELLKLNLSTSQTREMAVSFKDSIC